MARNTPVSPNIFTKQSQRFSAGTDNFMFLVLVLVLVLVTLIRKITTFFSSMDKGYYRLRGDFGPCLQPQPGAATMCIEVLSTFKESFKPLVTPHIEKNGKA